MERALKTPGDILEGSGLLLQGGCRIADVDYQLTIPSQTHFLMNPTGKLRPNYEEYAGGFILINPTEAENLIPSEYTLVLSNKSQKTVRVEKRYKKMTHKGQARISFWVKVINTER